MHIHLYINIYMCVLNSLAVGFILLPFSLTARVFCAQERAKRARQRERV